MTTRRPGESDADFCRRLGASNDIPGAVYYCGVWFRAPPGRFDDFFEAIDGVRWNRVTLQG